MQQPVEDDKTYLFYIDGGYDFDQKSGTSVAGGRYFWNPEHPHVGSGEETRIISSRADGVLLDQYVVYPFSVADASRLKCVVATCLHLLMNHAASRFCFVTDQADAIRDTLAGLDCCQKKKMRGQALWNSLRLWCARKHVEWVQCESRSKLNLDLRQQQRLKKEREARERQERRQKAIPTMTKATKQD